MSVVLEALNALIAGGFISLMLNNAVPSDEAGAIQTGRQDSELFLMRGNYLTKMKPIEAVDVLQRKKIQNFCISVFLLC